MATVKVRNAGNVALSVKIMNTRTLQKTEIMLQPKGGVTLPKDYVVDQNFLTRYKTVLRVIQKD